MMMINDRDDIPNITTIIKMMMMIIDDDNDDDDYRWI
jgi:hypothetical protein